MPKITTLRNNTPVKSTLLLAEDAKFFLNKFMKATNENEYCAIIGELYKHGYEDGFIAGRKNGKIIKLINL